MNALVEWAAKPKACQQVVKTDGKSYVGILKGSEDKRLRMQKNLAL